MIFKIKWGRIEKLLEEKYSDNPNQSPPFYFESKTELFVYLKKNGVYIYASIQKNKIKNLNEWKMEYLQNAEELVEQVRR